MKQQNEFTKNLFSHYFQLNFELYWKTHTAHWNIVSQDFAAIHKLLDEQYNQLWETLDEVAEHLRAYDLPAPVTLPQTSGLSFGSAREEFLNNLIAGHQEIIVFLKKAIRDLDQADDISGADLLTEKLAEHEKMAWMLKASL